MHDYWYKKNKTQLLRGFCAVMEEGGVVKASKKLNISQSSISLQISSLERDLDFQLFVRENQKLIPTEEAKRLYKISKKALEEIDLIFTNSKEAIKTDYDNLTRLAGHSYMLSHILPPYFKKMIKKNPQVKFELYNSHYTESMDMLEHGLIDFAIFPAKKEDLPKNIKMTEFYKCEFGLAMTKDHPLAKIPEKKINWEIISKHDLVTLGKGITAQGGKAVVKEYGLKSRFILHNGNWEICTGLISENLTLGAADIQYLKPFRQHDNLLIKSCPHLLPDYTFNILQNKNTIISASSKKLLELMKLS